MADTSGMADIRGIDIDKLAKGYAEEDMLMRKFVTNTPTSAREIRWYQKTAGFITAVTTTGSSAPIANVAELAQPNIVAQSWTRVTSYVQNFKLDSELISIEDIKDTDIDILAGNLRDLTRAIEYQIDKRIWDVISENHNNALGNISVINTNAAWDTASYTGVNAIEDIMDAKLQIRNNYYNPEGAILLLNQTGHKALITYLIDGKGSSIPSFSSQRVEDGVVQEILGVKVVVSNIVTARYGLLFIPQRSATWKEFKPTTAVTIDEPLIGTKIRVVAEGECLLTDPKSVCLLSNVTTA